MSRDLMEDMAALAMFGGGGGFPGMDYHMMGILGGRPELGIVMDHRQQQQRQQQQQPQPNRQAPQQPQHPGENDTSCGICGCPVGAGGMRGHIAGRKHQNKFRALKTAADEAGRAFEQQRRQREEEERPGVAVCEDPNSRDFVPHLHNSGSCHNLVNYGFKPDPKIVVTVKYEDDFSTDPVARNPANCRVLVIGRDYKPSEKPKGAKKILCKTLVNFCKKAPYLQQIEWAGSVNDAVENFGISDFLEIARHCPYIEAIRCLHLSGLYFDTARQLLKLLPRLKSIDARETSLGRDGASGMSYARFLAAFGADKTHPNLSVDL